MTPSDGPVEQGGIPPAEVIVDESLIRALLRSQHPDLAGLFGRFLACLHQPPPAGFPRNDYRGMPLANLDEVMRPRLGALGDAIRYRWDEAARAPVDVADACIHGDLHPRNLVVDQGRLAAVLDWGDMTAADPAADLAAAWLLFPVTAHAGVWDAYGRITAHTMARAAGWAVYFGVTLLTSGLASDPVLAGIGRTTLERVADGGTI